MAQSIQPSDFFRNIFLCSQDLDEYEWKLDLFPQKSQTEKTADLAAAEKTLQNVINYIRTLNFVDPSAIQHIGKKIQHLNNRILSLQPPAPVITHQQFTNSTNIPYPHINMNGYSQNARQPQSFSIGEAASNGQPPKPKLTTLQTMDRAAFLLKSGQEQQALNEISSLPTPIEKAIYEALWFVRGRPEGSNPIAHDNFGEVSFKNLEQRCFSTPQQKASAVELAKVHAAMVQITEAFEKNDSQAAYQIFDNLPTQIKNELYGKHWETMGKPTDKGATFGKDSLLGLNHDAPADNKATTFKNYLGDYRNKIHALQTAVETKRTEWASIDQDASLAGKKKNEAKIASLDALAQYILLILQNMQSVPRPAAKGESYFALAEAYAEAHPCLRPFLFQLLPTLKITSDKLIEGAPTHDLPKSSLPLAIDLVAMDDAGRKAYRTGIMNETLETLRQGYYINSKGKKVSLNVKPSVDSLYRLTGSNGPFQRQGKYATQIFMERKDCLTATKDCIERGLNPIVLDAASDDHFGGGYKTGAGAQEENISRRSGLSIAADTTQNVQTRNFYPLSHGGPGAGLYVSHVPVFRGEEKDGYPYLDQPFETAVAVMAAHNFNEEHQKHNRVPENEMKKLIHINGESRLPEKEAFETKEKIRTIFQMAEDNGHDAVVLIPLGCGAFRNPPKHFCEMAMELITQEFPHSFKEIRFSVIDDHNSNGNYAIVRQTIENGYINALNNIGAKYIVTQ